MISKSHPKSSPLPLGPRGGISWVPPPLRFTSPALCCSEDLSSSIRVAGFGMLEWLHMLHRKEVAFWDVLFASGTRAHASLWCRVETSQQLCCSVLCPLVSSWASLGPHFLSQ